MQPGYIAIFPMGASNGHHLVKESEADCAFVAIGRQGTGVVHYPDIDLVWNGPARRYAHKDGSPSCEGPPSGTFVTWTWPAFNSPSTRTRVSAKRMWLSKRSPLSLPRGNTCTPTEP